MSSKVHPLSLNNENVNPSFNTVVPGGMDETAKADVGDDFVKGLNDDMQQFHDHIHENNAQSVDGLDKAARDNALQSTRAWALNKDNSDSDDDIQLFHERDNAGEEHVKSIQKSFDVLKGQLDSYNDKLHLIRDKYNESESKVTELETQNQLLEEDLHEMQEHVTELAQDRGNNRMMIVGGGKDGDKNGGGGRKDGNKLRLELKGAQDYDDDELDLNEFDEKRSFYRTLMKYIDKIKPFKKDIGKIQSRFGAAVSSYLIFYRFIFLQICFIGAIGILFTVLHIVFILAYHNSSFTSIMTGNGLLPNFMLPSSYHGDEAFQYTLFLIIGLCVFLVTIIEHLLTEDRLMKRVDAQEVGNEAQYTRDILCGWDFANSDTEKHRQEQAGSLANRYKSLLDESLIVGMQRSRSNFDLIVLFSRRFLGFILYLIIQGASFSAIAIVTIYTDTITNQLTATSLKNFSGIVAPAALAVINAAAPIALKKITELESWDSGDLKLNVLLFRMYLSNIMNTLVLALSYLLLADPLLFASSTTVRKYLELEESGIFACRADQCADAMFSLIVSNFFIQNISKIAMPYGKWYGKTCLGMSYKLDPFEIEPAMINLFNTMSLVMIAFPFSQLCVILAPLMVYINIKWECYVMLRWHQRPEKSWKHQKSGVIFTTFYLVTLFLIGIPAVMYFLSTKSFPKDCDIQDEGVDLCTDSLDADNTCTQDSGHKYYDYTKDINYPKDICSTSCGAFTNYDTTFQPFKDIMYRIPTLNWIWRLGFEMTYIPWTLVLLLTISRNLQANTNLVVDEAIENKDRVTEAHTSSLQAELRKKDRMMKKLSAEKEAMELAQLQEIEHEQH